jgi:5-methyltetrahydrofolate--homocysteine methyltransferase
LKPGVTVLNNYSIAELAEYIDWTPFFHSWEMKGSYPKILSDPERGVEATKLFNDAKAMLERIIAEKWIQAHAVIGLFPANAEGDDILVYADDSRKTVKRARLHTFVSKRENHKVSSIWHWLILLLRWASNVKDYIGAFAVTAGAGIDEYVARFEANHDDYNAIMLKAIADRLAEAFAERLHQRVRKEFWGYAADEHFCKRRAYQRGVCMAFVQLRVIPLNLIILKNYRYGHYSTSRKIPESHLPKAWR